PGSTDAKGNELPDVPNEDECMVTVNGQFVLHGTWGGQILKFLSTDTPSQTFSSISASQLLGVRPTDTTGTIAPIAITFAQQKQTTVPACRFAINWIDIGYDRMYYAYQDALTFHAPKYSTAGLYQFTLQNFDRTDISIYRKGVSKISNVVITSNPRLPRSTRAIFQLNISSGADEFIAVVDSGKLKPSKYVRDDFANLHSPTNAGAYIIITNRDHLPKGNSGATTPVQDLASYRAANNHVTTKVIDVAYIYDEFNYGIRSPNAIKAFLTYAYHNWQDPPKYVLLVGVTHQGNDDPQLYTPPDQVPTPYIQAYLEGTVAGDAWYTMLDGDDLLPDIILGRLASQDIATDAAYVAKLKEYEADGSTPGDWKDRALFIGAAGGFDQDIDGILDRNLPERVSVLRQSTVPTSPYHGARQTLFNNVNNGLGLVAYFGHGGADIWDDPIDSSGGGPFLTNEDVGNFHNQGRYPLILSMTCFTATYDGNGVLGILNSLQNQSEAGSIAALGTTSFGWEQNDTHLAEAVIPQVYDSSGGLIAERIVNGKMNYLLEGLSGDLIPPTLMYCYHFLGDPMLELHPPTDRASLTLSSRVIQPSGTVTLSGTTSITQGTARIELANDEHSPLSPPDFVDNIPVTNGTFSVTANVPNTTMPYGLYRAIVYDKNSNHFAAAAEDVTITNSRITELDFEPKPLAFGSPLDFSAAVQSPQPITSVTANINIYSQSSNGAITMRALPPMAMVPSGDRYHTTIASSTLNAGDKVVASITLIAPPDSITSDSIYIV
ncbi:MAG TPA: C25 family cysteine peptidase, partial [Candidatus Kapabacteria bacterium]|nr:C25 family cysteine peptidase [Candidatus Kapabacteria bacterium]